MSVQQRKRRRGVQETFYGIIGVVGAHNVPQIRLGPEFKLGTKVRVTVTKVRERSHGE